ncbi:MULTISPECIES: DUF4870 domain-containing protein [Staphylococcus]|jgi:uncharacterized Tic20 family protein|uniref:DUF4870 domain-containing protein n=1 Tax=Staphylococcus nepalensis TaxID=214473 RepID=A0ABS3L3K9_9STAP|nr:MULTISPECIES: DUF4870 domain-containing protein [Staphylococcus]MBO1205959.1 DUF4870 domain-containing protein [Staphylococcus nepalensis]MBO1214634.1 DUF4870 domain-containing protein [Staphylococcus nepalensis]MBO1216666.1 DUF4870 domain-containing protein [Staphylococcus nepalensis]MBO1227590.1 DUF4870 domain-containing protein [Staphylococcus nepalensis]MBO1235668.1 DUF4870 domain-containing protein [Staphylococcus nepalensis]
MNEQSLHSDTQGGRVLSSISYFSIFFAPIILPIIIWIFADKPASAHAAKSLFYHIITYIGPVFIAITLGLGSTLLNQQQNTITVIAIIFSIILIILTIWYTIKNVYRGVKVLISENAYFNP